MTTGIDAHTTAYDSAAVRPFHEVVSELQQLLGPRLTAYVANVAEARTLREWAEGEREARPPVPARLRFTLGLARLVRTALEDEGPDADVGGFFEMPSRNLGGRSLARVLREEDIQQVAPEVFEAVEARLNAFAPSRRLRKLSSD
jgi:hypothetical protein